MRLAGGTPTLHCGHPERARGARSNRDGLVEAQLAGRGG